MIFVGESRKNNLILFGTEGDGYFYIEFTGDIETPKIEKINLDKEVLISLLEKNLSKYSLKGLNIVFERMDER